MLEYMVKKKKNGRYPAIKYAPSFPHGGSPCSYKENTNESAQRTTKKFKPKRTTSRVLSRL